MTYHQGEIKIPVWFVTVCISIFIGVFVYIWNTSIQTRDKADAENKTFTQSVLDKQISDSQAVVQRLQIVSDNVLVLCTQLKAPCLRTKNQAMK